MTKLMETKLINKLLGAAIMIFGGWVAMGGDKSEDVAKPVAKPVVKPVVKPVTDKSIV